MHAKYVFCICFLKARQVCLVFVLEYFLSRKYLKYFFKFSLLGCVRISCIQIQSLKVTFTRLPPSGEVSAALECDQYTTWHASYIDTYTAIILRCDRYTAHSYVMLRRHNIRQIINTSMEFVNTSQTSTVVD